MAYQETEQHLTEQFFFSKDTLLCMDAPLPHPQSNPANDDILLREMQTAIQLRDISGLKKQLSLLPDSYQERTDISYIYFRFLCTNILKMLLDPRSKPPEKTFDEYACIIYESRHISEIESLLYPLADQLAVELDRESNNPQYVLQLVKQYIHKHLHQGLSLDILAAQVNLTPRYLSALFIEKTGGINRYIKNERMKKARELLLETSLKVSEICQKVGYSNLSYFCKSFTEAFGTTPNQFRNASFSREEER